MFIKDVLLFNAMVKEIEKFSGNILPLNVPHPPCSCYTKGSQHLPVISFE